MDRISFPRSDSVVYQLISVTKTAAGLRQGRKCPRRLYVVDHARAIDTIFHRGKVAETYNIGGFNEWRNIDLIRVVIRTVDRLLGRSEVRRSI